MLVVVVEQDFREGIWLLSVTGVHATGLGVMG